MNLQETLQQMKEQMEANIPPETLQIMHRATAELINSGIADSTLQRGDQAPTFTLLDEKENEISSEKLLATGPLVLSFYRGVW